MAKNLTPAELDKISNKMLGKTKCERCNATFPKFTALVEHKKKTGH